VFALSQGAEPVPQVWLDTGGGTESIALSQGERVSRSGAFTSRSGTGEGSLAQFCIVCVILLGSVFFCV